MSTQTPPLAEVQEPVLVPVLSARFALRAVHVALTGVFAALLLLANYMPLRNTDLWGHVLYGQWILAHGALPVEDPIQPLAEGMRVVDASWLAQVVLAVVQQRWGAEGLSSVFAGTLWLTYLLLARACWLQTRSLGATLAATLVALAVGFSRLSTIRPEMFSLLCLALLLWWLAPRRGEAAGEVAGGLRGAATWLFVPGLFVVWANLHGSFVCGLALLACQTLGQALETAWRQRSVGAALRDRAMRRWLYLTELAAAATLLNPYGIDLWIEVARFGRNPNLAAITEWGPLVVHGVGGREFVGSIVLLIALWRHSRRRVTAAEVVLLGLMALAALTQVRMMGWYALVLSWVLAPHAADVLSRWGGGETASDGTADDPAHLPSGRSWRYSLACLALGWAAFAFSTFSRPLLGGQPRAEAALYNADTPQGVTGYLREHPPEGLVFAPQSWGDWLAWAGPPGLRPFAATHVHLLPPKVWEDYQRLVFVEAGSDAALDRYKVMMVVVDKENQPLLNKAMRRAGAWALRYEDDQAAVFTRIKPAGASSAPPAEPPKVAQE